VEILTTMKSKDDLGNEEPGASVVLVLMSMMVQGVIEGVEYFGS
jgi:hypothetical protein